MNAAPMTPEEYEHFARAVGSRVTEFLDGFAVVGFHATTGQPLIFTHAGDFKTRCALNNLLQLAMCQSSAAAQQPPPSNGNTGS